MSCELRQFLGRLSTVKLGPTEWQTEDRTDTSARGRQEGLFRTEELSSQLKEADRKAEHDKKAFQKIVMDQVENTRYWEFMYLNLFLVTNTKQVLLWFYSNRLVCSRQVYDQRWWTQIPDSNQRKIILDVLLSHELLFKSPQEIAITPKGSSFVENWLRPPLVSPLHSKR